MTKFITNLNPESNHHTAITDALQGAESVDLAIAFISHGAIQFINNFLVDEQGVAKPMRVVTTTDRGITNHKSLEKLLGLGAQVKVLNHRDGLFHPKLWIFHNTFGGDSCLIGSANFTHMALTSNIECGMLTHDEGIVRECQKSFDRWWRDSSCIEVDQQYVETWKAVLEKEDGLKKRAAAASPGQNILGYQELTGFIDRRLGDSGTWRGWYIIPDHGDIDDGMLSNLQAYCKIIIDSGQNATVFSVTMNEAENGKYREMLKLMERRLQRKKHRTSLHRLFVRREKNYLEKFGFIYVQPRGRGKSKEMILTEAGIRLAKATDMDEMRAIFTDMVSEIEWHGVRMHEVMSGLVDSLGYISYSEFEYFVSHFFATDDIEVCRKLILSFRQLDEQSKSALRSFVDKKLETIATDLGTVAVVSNYKKKQRTTMSVFAACDNIASEEVDGENSLVPRR